ncbi:hypothetical protein N7513_008569 [Penicillium frequentans]|nr:hypothetical protein N7513_008569 [Penicillium glabrum]
MRFTQLSPECEALRQQIKALVPTTTTRDDQINNTREALMSSEKPDGSKFYGGYDIHSKLAHMAVKIRVGDDMIYKVVSWPDTPAFSFAEERGFIISLHEIRAVTGTFQEGYMVQVYVNEGDFVEFVGKGTAILIVPRKNGVARGPLWPME